VVLADLASALALLVARLVVVAGALLLLLVVVGTLAHHEVALAGEVGRPHGWVVVATHWWVVLWASALTTTCWVATATTAQR